jgi:hypothetical protein
VPVPVAKATSAKNNKKKQAPISTKKETSPVTKATSAKNKKKNQAPDSVNQKKKKTSRGSAPVSSRLRKRMPNSKTNMLTSTPDPNTPTSNSKRKSPASLARFHTPAKRTKSTEDDNINSDAKRKAWVIISGGNKKGQSPNSGGNKKGQSPNSGDNKKGQSPDSCGKKKGQSPKPAGEKKGQSPKPAGEKVVQPPISAKENIVQPPHLPEFSSHHHKKLFYKQTSIILH